MSKKSIARLRRHRKIRSQIHGTAKCPRLSVFRGLEHIYAQLIDDEKGMTIVSASDMKMKEGISKDNNLKGKSAKAYMIGIELAKKAKEKGITRIVFDRGGFQYHGRVSALADGARKGGLEF